MPQALAGALVFVCSAAVLVLEILAGRMLAPYVGVSLETYTGIIGVVLAGISLGTWAGGRLADRVSPRRTLGPLVILGGGLALVAVPVVRLVGEASEGGGRNATIVLLSFVGFFAPAAVLSAVTPTVVKLQLHDLGETGRVVGRLSALGTAGAIVGTFATGFVLIAAWPTRGIVLVLGAILVVLGAALWLWLRRRPDPVPIAFLGLAIVAGLLALSGAGASPCQWESAYFCGRVERDAVNPSGRLLILDTVMHSYVDLRDPKHLEFSYTRAIRDVVDGVRRPPAPLRALHVGGGGFTMPRYLRATRPGTRSLVLEIDAELVRQARRRLGLVTGPDLEVRVGDARLGVQRQPDAAYDVVVGDAFGGLSVPWHLTTREFVEDVRRVLRPGGVYVLNVIDFPPNGFARAEVATLRAVFPHVAVVAPGFELSAFSAGNFVLVGSRRPLPLRAIRRRIEANGDGIAIASGGALRRFQRGADVLTDDHAPVDQLITIPD
jgi:SAM-dependent methyltransferase